MLPLCGLSVCQSTYEAAAPALMRHVLLAFIAGAARGSRLAIDFSTDEAFSITIDGTPWLRGGGASLFPKPGFFFSLTHGVVGGLFLEGKKLLDLVRNLFSLTFFSSF